MRPPIIFVALPSPPPSPQDLSCSSCLSSLGLTLSTRLLFSSSRRESRLFALKHKPSGVACAFAPVQSVADAAVLPEACRYCPHRRLKEVFSFSSCSSTSASALKVWLMDSDLRVLDPIRQFKPTFYHRPSRRSVFFGLVVDPSSFPSFSVQGIWRIPVDEIDRPGSFASHMNRSIVLLLEVLYQLKDHDTLLKVSFMLQRTPDQGK